MAGIDATIPLGVKTQDGMTSLASIANTATAFQNFQTGAIQQKRTAIQLQQEQAAVDAQTAVSKIVTDPQFRDPDTGAFDLNRGAAAIVQADPKDYHATKAISALAKANNDILTVKKNAVSLADTSRALLGSTLGALTNDPNLSKATITGALDILSEQAPDAKPAIDVWRRHLQHVPDEPAVLNGYLKTARNQAMPPSTQNAAMTPSGVQVNNAQQSQVVNTNPGAGAVGAVIPGTTAQMQLPPTTPVFNPQTNAPGYLGPQPAPAAAGGAPGADLGHDNPSPQIDPATQQLRDAWRARAIQSEIDQVSKWSDSPTKRDALAALETERAAMQPKAAPTKASFVQSGPSLGQAENVAGTVKTVNEDWQKTSEQAAAASQNIGVLQNIKKYAPGAVTGVAGDRRAYIAGLAGLLGMDSAQLEKTNTDLLAKNSSMLALAGGNTDLARVMAESANPGKKMTQEAITAAADQIIAQQKLALAKQQYMSHFKGDPEQYTKELAAFNQVADPRVLQVPDMTDAEIAKMKAAMKPTELKEFGQKLRKVQAMGLFK